MEHHFSRRDLFQTSVGLYLATRAKLSAAPATESVPSASASPKSVVGLVRGENRTANIKAALELIDADVRRKLVGKKSVIIKPNLVSSNRQLAATHADALRGIIDYLGPRWKGPIYIAESSAGETFDGYKSFKYDEVVRDFKIREIKMVDLNEEALAQLPAPPPRPRKGELPPGLSTNKQPADPTPSEL